MTVVLTLVLCMGCEPKTYRVKGKGFSLVLPKDWIRGSESQYHMTFHLDQEKNTRGDYPVVFGLALASPAENRSLEEHFQNSFSLMDDSPKFSKKEEGATKIDGIDAKWVRYDYEGTEQLSYVVLVDGQGYLITFITPLDKLGNHEKEFTRILNGIKFE